eukprot:TRINITY_DN10507_c0_g1_i1.p1 TRINITY_DN10507_c0_g1~~TRINITY_DN10507_c0_g1_i1.p1  ORF type:complete len:291 (-),score=39.50 TRINITY_DN10507_c0_g1_i1:108-980(-)
MITLEDDHLKEMKFDDQSVIHKEQKLPLFSLLLRAVNAILENEEPTVSQQRLVLAACAVFMGCEINSWKEFKSDSEIAVQLLMRLFEVAHCLGVVPRAAVLPANRLLSGVDLNSLNSECQELFLFLRSTLDYITGNKEHLDLSLNRLFATRDAASSTLMKSTNVAVIKGNGFLLQDGLDDQRHPLIAGLVLNPIQDPPAERTPVQPAQKVAPRQEPPKADANEQSAPKINVPKNTSVTNKKTNQSRHLRSPGEPATKARRTNGALSSEKGKASVGMHLSKPTAAVRTGGR